MSAGQVLAAALVIVLAGFFLAFHVHDGQSMDEDFAVYLQEATNIVHGKPYSDVGVVYALDPGAELRDQAPLTYPPAVPLVLAPVVGAAGFNFLALKESLLALLLLTFVLMAAFHRRLGFSLFEMCGTVAVFVLLPAIRVEVNEIGSDLPFLFFLVAALLAIEVQLAAPPARRLGAAILVGVASFVAFDARVVAVALLPAAALAHLVRDKRQTRWVSILVPGAVFVLLWLVQSRLFSQQSAYSYVFTHKFFDIFGNMKAFYWHMAGPWDHTRIGGFAYLIVLATSALAGLGAVDGMRRSQAAAWFCAVYLAELLILPNFDAGMRYLIPLLLFLGAFAFRGSRVAASLIKPDGSWNWRVGAATAAGFILLMLFVPLGGGPVRFGALSAPTSETFAYIRTHTEGGALIAARKYRAFHLFTGRRTIHPPIAALASSREFSSWAATNRVDYVVLKTSSSATNNDYTDCPEDPLCRAQTGDAKLVFQNSDYRLLRLGKPWTASHQGS